MLLSERIRQLRIHKGMNQAELVEGICSITYLSRIENGKIKPSKSFLQKISQKLDVAIEYLTENDIKNFEITIQETTEKYKETNSLSENELLFLEIQSLEMHPTPILSQVYGVLLHHYVRLHQIKNANRVYNQSIKFLPDKIQDFTEETLYYFISCGNYFYSKQNFIKANEYYLNADHLMGGEETIHRANLYYNMGLVKQRLNKRQNISRFYSLKAYEIYKKLNRINNIISVLITLGVQYHLDKKYEEAKECLEKAEELVSLKESPTLLGMIKYNYGRIHQGMKDYDQAILHFQKSLDIHYEEGNEKERIYSLRGLIEIYSELREWSRVNHYINEAIHIVKEYDLSYLYVEIHVLLADFYKIRGDDYQYEKEMQQIIEFAINHNQFLLIKKQAVKLGEHYYSINAYKMSAKYYQIALKYEIHTEEIEYNPI
ncbi:helix-turn-helix domain-containing protein [Peribacillus sp. NPDC096622]|uniref:helix-turn-helix domain-containing protein n=1 Tax=Peribacillus sp. NPDC096622 TaxID=3364396 RepID=UPI00381F6266